MTRKEHERIKGVRVKPKKLTDLPEELLVKIMEKVDEENIESVPQICIRLRDIFEKFEHKFVPPATYSKRPSLTCRITEKGVELKFVKNTTMFVKNTTRQIIPNPSFSRLRRYLRNLYRLDFVFGANPPACFTVGTNEFNTLKAFIKDHCFIHRVSIVHPQIDNVAGNIMNLFSDLATYWILIDIEKLLMEPATFYNKNIECLEVKGITPKDLAVDLMYFKYIEYLSLCCSEPLIFYPFIEEWKKNKRTIKRWVIKCPVPGSPRLRNTIFRQYEGDKVLKVKITTQTSYVEFVIAEE